MALIVALAPIADLVEREPADARPASGRKVTFEVSGSQGGRNGGRGAVIVATADLASGTEVRVTVGGTKGYNGGGDPGAGSRGAGGAGGGASDVRIGGTSLTNRVLVAAGGGGRGGERYEDDGGAGGAGALRTGRDGNNGRRGWYGYGGGGGRASRGGPGGSTNWCRSGSCLGSAGESGVGGPGGRGLVDRRSNSGGGGGGGGGYFGGGGGGGSVYSSGAGGGGGGSSYVDPSRFPSGPTAASSGARSGGGRVRISLDGGSTWVATYDYSGSTQTYTVPWAPVVSGMNATSGPTTGGTAVVLTGKHLSDVTAVSFCGNPGTGLTVESDTTVSVATPGAAGKCRVVVQTNVSGSTTAPGAFYYYAVPSVATASPSVGPLSGGSIDLTGSGFSGAKKVTIGGQKATFSVNSDTSITATAPAAAAGEATIAVTTKFTTGTGPATFTYTEAPTIASVAPQVGPIAGGTSVTITGTHFGPATSVGFGATPAASFTVDSATQITAVTPALGLGPSDVSVATPGGPSVTAGAFHAYPTADVTGVSPAAGPTMGGDTVVLTGTNLASVDAVNFGATAATSFTVDSDTEITAVTPAGAAGTVPVGISNPGATGTSSVGYTFVEAPTVTTVDPVTIESDTSSTVALTGTHLTGATSVQFGGTDAVSFTVDSDAQITAATPSLLVGDHDVAITTAGGTATGTITALTTPTVISLSPAAGPAVGGTTVTVMGAGLTGTSSVQFGGTDATSFTVDSDTELTVVTPAGDVGVAEIVVGNALHASPPKVFTYTEPVVLKIVGDATDVRPGSTVEVSGSGFAPNTKIDILLFSTPRHLGTVSSDKVGRFVATVEVPADTDAGAHLLVATGIDPFGEVKSVSLDVEVLAIRQSDVRQEPVASAADPSVPSSLAATGRGHGIAVRSGLIMLILGALMVSAGQQRSVVRRERR